MLMKIRFESLLVTWEKGKLLVSDFVSQNVIDRANCKVSLWGRVSTGKKKNHVSKDCRDIKPQKLS